MASMIRIGRLIAGDFAASDRQDLLRFRREGTHEVTAEEMAEIRAEADFQANETDDLWPPLRRAYLRLIKQIDSKQ